MDKFVYLFGFSLDGYFFYRDGSGNKQMFQINTKITPSSFVCSQLTQMTYEEFEKLPYSINIDTTVIQ